MECLYFLNVVVFDGMYEFVVIVFNLFGGGKAAGNDEIS